MCIYIRYMVRKQRNLISMNIYRYNNVLPTLVSIPCWRWYKTEGSCKSTQPRMHACTNVRPPSTIIYIMLFYEMATPMRSLAWVIWCWEIIRYFTTEMRYMQLMVYCMGCILANHMVLCRDLIMITQYAMVSRIDMFYLVRHLIIFHFVIILLYKLFS